MIEGFRFLFFSIKLIPVLLVITTEPMIGVDTVRRSGFALWPGVWPGKCGSLMKDESVTSEVEISHRSNEASGRTGGVSLTMLTLDRGAEVALCIAGTFFRVLGTRFLFSGELGEVVGNEEDMAGFLC